MLRKIKITPYNGRRIVIVVKGARGLQRLVLAADSVEFHSASMDYAGNHI
jgi:hypothetical protein